MTAKISEVHRYSKKAASPATNRRRPISLLVVDVVFIVNQKKKNYSTTHRDIQNMESMEMRLTFVVVVTGASFCNFRISSPKTVKAVISRVSSVETTTY
jgi:hypothetical protein